MKHLQAHHLPFAGVVALASRTAGRVGLEAVLADLGALLERAGRRGHGAALGRRRRRRGLARHLLGRAHGSADLLAQWVDAPADQAVARALARLVLAVCSMMQGSFD